jgi:hypothetical protein
VEFWSEVGRYPGILLRLVKLLKAELIFLILAFG